MFSVAIHDPSHALATHLLRADGDEDIAFALWFPSRGARRTTALLGNFVLPEDGDRRVCGNVEFHPQYFERALSVARQAGAGLALLHSHPPYSRGWQALSTADESAEGGIAGAVRAATGKPLVGLTLAGDRTWSARFWRRTAPFTYTPNACESVRVLAEGMRTSFFDDLRPVPPRSPQLGRTISAWGEHAQAELSRLKVGIAGAGSVGSIVAEGLARMGIEQLVLIDFDTLETVNLDRTMNGYVDQADGRTSKVVAISEGIRRGATSASFEARTCEFSICEEEGYRAALDCDVIFSCVDRPWPRSILNFIAYAHLIPVVDGGIAVSRTPSGRMRGADWKAHIAMPGRACLACLKQYDPGLVQAEREGHFEDPRYIEALPSDHPAKQNENVFAFSLNLASLEVLQLISLVVGPAGVHDLGAQAYHMAIGRMDVEHPSCESACPISSLAGRGEDAGHPGTGSHEAAEVARRTRAGTL